MAAAVSTHLACNGATETEREPPPPPPPVVDIPIVEEPAALTPISEPEGPRHAIFDLVDNRHLAHREVAGGLYLDAGSPGFGRYVHGNRPRQFYLDEESEGRRVAHPARSTISLYVPLSEAQAGSAEVIALTLWSDAARGPFDVRVAGERLGQQRVDEEGWHTLRWELPAGALRAGENELELTWASSGTRSGTRARSALAGVFIGPAPAEGAEVPAPMPWARTGATQLDLGPGEGAAYYVVLPEEPAISLLPDFLGATPADACEVSVSLSTEAGPVGRYALVPARLPEEQRGAALSLPLEGAPSGEIVRMEVRANQACPALALRDAALTAPGEAPTVPAFEPPRNVLIYLVDTLRADRLRAINPSTRVIGEAFDRFAAEGTTFTSAYVQGNESFASHAALFAGRYPSATGVYNSADHLGDENELLEELARRAGLYTGGYSSNGHIRSTNGFEQGFNVFVNTLRDGYRYLAPGMLAHTLRFIDEHGDEPWFFYLGTVDCHVTYRSHEDILPLYDPDPYSGPFMRTVGGDELGRIKSGAMPVTARDRVRIEAIYDDTVTFTDRHFGMLLEELAERGILDQTLIILTADHGDEFWEHGSVGHGHNVYDELVHVPLLVRYPGAIPAGRVVDVGVDTVDILPTVAELLGLEPDEAVQGESLVGLANGVDAGYPRPAYTQMYGHTMAMRLAGWKVIWRAGGERRLYDLRNDPTEQEDVSAEHPYALRYLSDAMGLFLPYRSVWQKREWGVASNLRAGFPGR